MEEIVSVRGRKPRVQVDVFKALQNHPHEPVSMDTLAQESGLTPLQVRDAVYHLRKRFGVRIDDVIRGQVWRYVPSGGPEVTQAKSNLAKVPTVAQPPRGGPVKRTFEEIGQTRDGRFIIQSAEGGLYEAKEL